MPTSVDGWIAIDDTDIAEAVRHLRDARQAIEALKRVEDDAKAVLLEYAEANMASTLTVDGFRVARVVHTSTPGRWDKQRLRRDLGEAWHAYWIEGTPYSTVRLA